MLICHVLVVVFFAIYVICVKEENLPSCPMHNNTVNVKTVLWRITDTCRKCWGKQDIIKVYARRAVQHLLPGRIPKHVELLLNYLIICWNFVPKFTTEGSMDRYVLTAAMADAIGGYLQAVVLPIANEAYYAGNVDYKVMQKLYYLFEELKMEVGTDGGGWAKPCDMKRIATKVSALQVCEVPAKMDVSACAELHMPIPKTNRCSTSTTPGPKLDLDAMIPRPFLDDNQSPNAIAIPLKDQLLYSLHSVSSANILVRYYITALRCIGLDDTQTLLRFNHAFYKWIISNVVPHLHERNKWYLGFGSVMKIIETMHQKGWLPEDEGKPSKNKNKLFDPDATADKCMVGIQPDLLTTIFNKLFNIWTAMILTLLLIFCYICCCICRPGCDDDAGACCDDSALKYDSDDVGTNAGTLNTDRRSTYSAGRYGDETDTTSETSEGSSHVRKRVGEFGEGRYSQTKGKKKPSKIPKFMHDVDIPVKKATFALGCFWGAESLYGAVVGVVRTKVGYAGGTTSNPTYNNIYDHSEAVDIEYDPVMMSFEYLLDIFWANHDPTRDTHVQNKSRESSIIFYRGNKQKAIAENSMKRQKTRRSNPILTVIRPAKTFYDAELYHQKYRLQQHPWLCDNIGLKSNSPWLKTSHLCTRLNGFVVGNGTLDQFEQEAPMLGLEGNVKRYVHNLIANKNQN